MSKRSGLEEMAASFFGKFMEKTFCRKYHKVHEEPGDREGLMKCYKCGLRFTRDMAIEYGVNYEADNN